MGNLTCIFEVAHWNLESQTNPSDLERRRNCGKLRYRPHKDWVAPDPTVVFEKLPHGSTIYMLGDSVGNQHAVDLMCYLASNSRIIRVNVNHFAQKAPEADLRGKYAGLGLSGATFRSYGGNKTKDIHVVMGSGNFGVFNKNQAISRFTALMNKGRKDDIFVLNQGLHYKAKEALLNDLNAIKPVLLSSIDRGARVIWRETNAVHFNATNGYYSPETKALQERKSAHCVSSSMINATSSRNYYGMVTPLMKSWGIHVLETWEASFLMPEWCHVGGGVDCAHFLQPGGTSFFTESLLKYIEEEM